MYYYVYLQPEIFKEALADGEDARHLVTGILSGFEQNCFLAVFEDDRWEMLVGNRLADWPTDMTRRRVTVLLAHFRKNGRLLYCLTPDYDSVMSDMACVLAQATEKSIDLLLVTATEAQRPASSGVEVAGRRNYPYTKFEDRRSHIAVRGKTCAAGEMEESDFMDFHFRKALSHATSIDICDRVCGSTNFKDNFQYTTMRFMAWLERTLHEPSACSIVFHFGRPFGPGDQFILHEISGYKTGRLAATPVEVRFYDDPQPNAAIPHQRFVMTEAIALDIDRGLDFLDRATGKCRDTYVNYQDRRETEQLLTKYTPIARHVV